MTFEEFREYIEEHILEGWKEDVDVSVRMVQKNNGVKLYGLYIRDTKENISPAIYLEEYYDYYLKGESPDEVIMRIREEYEQVSPKIPAYAFNLEDFAYVKDRVIYRLVNYEKNAEMLKECPYLKLYDLALTFRWVAHSNEIGISTAMITNQEMEKWEISLSDLILAARENTKRLFPPRILEMGEMLRRAGLDESLAAEGGIHMYVLTNRQEINGASVLLYEDVLHDFAKEKECDFYVLPSSIHEVIMVPEVEIDDPEALFDMVRDANHTVVSLGDVLSDSVYYYDRENNQLRLLTRKKCG